MSEEKKKPSIDERLEALVESLELLRLESRDMQAKMDRLDSRERKAREALLAGIAAYLRALQNGDGDAGKEGG